MMTFRTNMADYSSCPTPRSAIVLALPIRGLSVLLLCYVTSFLATACTVRPMPDGLHVHCTQGSPSSLPDLAPDTVVWLDMARSGLTQLPDFQFLSHLKALNVSHNAITQIDKHHLQGASRLQSLDLSHNQLWAVREHSFGDLSSLNTLLLHHNRLTWLEDGAFLGLPHLQVLNLQGNNLTSVSHGTFRGLTYLTSLDLSQNHLDRLDNSTFSDLVSLRQLTVSGNQLTHLEQLAFTGLNQLTEINLDWNQLHFEHESLPPGVFAPLKSVEIFSFVHNDGGASNHFPQAVFSDLVSVKYLSIDSFFYLHFGADFSKMSAIDTLDLHHGCRAHHFSNNTFFGFKNSSLQNIKASDCPLVFVDKCAFCDLPHLMNLDLSHAEYLYPTTALLSLYGLQGQTMEEINLEHTGRLQPKYFTIDRKHVQYVKNICLRRLRMAMCHLQRWKANAVFSISGTEFARCVEHFDISENILRGDVGGFLVIFTMLTNLTSFLFQEQNIYSLKTSTCILSDALECGNRGRESETRGKVSFSIPQTLQYINASSAFNYFNAPPSVLYFENATGLKTMDLSYGAFSNCLTTLAGLGQLETLDLSGNYCDKISDSLLDYLPSLKHLSMAHSHLTAADMRTRAHRLLSKVVRLETLDLSWNWLLEIEGHSLPHQKLLKTLLLGHNSFQSLPVDIDRHPDLAVLDLSFNTITSLTSSERTSLDALASRHPVRLGLHGNPLLCACSNVDFLQWLWDTKVTLDGEGNSTRRYTCTSDTGQLTDTEQVMAEWQLVWRRCVGQHVFGWAMAAFLVQMMALLITFMISRSWTYLKYAWNVLRRLRMPTRQDFRKDVYIAYANEDAELACLHLPRLLQGHDLRFLLRHQEELPGSVMADNIVQFIDDSWKVLLLVTEAFAEDDWSCGFTVHQAQRAITDTLPNRVLVLFLEDPRHHSPMASLETLLRHYSERNVFHVPRDTPAEHPVWDRLATAILQR